MSKAFLEMCFNVAVKAALPHSQLPGCLPEPPRGRYVVMALGKGAGPLAEAFESAYSGSFEGIAVAPQGTANPTQTFRWLESSHPYPDARSVAAGEYLLKVAGTLGPDDLLLVLLSGGASSLIATPPASLSLSDLQTITKALLNGGANIQQLNAVRRRFSKIAGGRLATAAAPARVVTLAVSDVTGDDPADIASGPTAPDKTTREDVEALLGAFGLLTPESKAFLASSESLTAGPRDLEHTQYQLLATPQKSLEAVETYAAEQGFHVLNLGAFVEGDANEVAKVHAALARQVATHDAPVKRPALILSGGETAVRVTGQGRGGRNVQFAMALAAALDGLEGVTALAADTDGVDGSEAKAGGLLDSSTLNRARALGYPVEAALANNDGHGWFEALGDDFVSGPTGTNVNDLRLIAVQSS